MPKIQVLSAHIANQIAAGEVIERPASIVKELVENAVDAGASTVTIEIENGGIDGIRICDNGCGIGNEDVATAFLRHATSKLRAAEDLSHIETLGFRGEALASIAAVASVTLSTRTDDEELGSELRVRGGASEKCRRIGCNRGTVIEVRELFFNAPARLKFLKSARAESGAIGDYVAKLIMSLPSIAFRYVNNGKTVYQSLGDGDLKNAILCVYGAEIESQLFPVAFDDGYFKISGYIGAPSLSRFNRSAQCFFLNRRIIRSAALSNALSRAYDTRLMVGRFPFGVLSLNIASAEVDVNVHPAKLEVRFVDEPRVIRSVHVACSEALTRSYVPPAQEPDLPSSPIRSTFSMPRSVPAGIPGVPASRPLREGYGEHSDIPHVRISSVFTPPQREEEPASAPFSEPYTVVGCAFLTYWFVQQGEALFCIDQHAAHERLLYDALMARKAPVVSQTLLFTESVTLSPAEKETLLACKSELEAFGYLFTTDTDALSVTLLAVPQIHGTPLKSAFLHDALVRLETAGSGESLLAQDFVRDAIAQTACKHAIKAGETITHEELETLLDALSAGDTLLTCPHGRPIAVRLSRTELEKWFKRIP